jgi:ornithine cyclodeaminase/alanine dehydrogenase
LLSAGLKWVSGFPENPKQGLPYISGLIVLNDDKTGIPLSIMDCTWITAKRTGAATAVAAKYLARSDAKVLGILGCGVQGRSNLEALRAIFPLERVMAYDIRREAAECYREEMGKKFGLEVLAVEEPARAVKGCDIVVTAGPILKVPHATIKPGWLESGAFGSLVDYDSYWHRDALREADKFCTDDVPQLEYYRSIGYFRNIPPVYADLGELVTGRKLGRQSAKERTITCNLGLALEDMATAPLVYRLAVKKGIGTWLPL